MIDGTIAQYGTLDCLINNVGANIQPTNRNRKFNRNRNHYHLDVLLRAMFRGRGGRGW